MVSGKTGAAIAGAGLGSIITYLLTHPSEAQAAGAPEGVDPETWAAITTIIQTIQEQNARLEVALSQVVTLVGGEGYALKNPETFIAGPLLCPVAGQGYQIPPKIIPWDIEFVVKALSTNAGLIYIANNEIDAGNAAIAYPLLPNEAVGLQIANSKEVWVSAQLAGEGVSFIVEQK